MNYLEGDVNIESDYEEVPPGVDGERSNSREEKEEQVRAILIAGSFSAYAHFPGLALFWGEMTNYLAGNLYSSIAVRTRSCSPPSNPKAPTVA